MKQIIETKMVEQTTVKFVADDGTVFMGDRAENDCKAYERRKNRDLVEDRYARLHPRFISFPFADSLGEFSAEIINVKSNDDFDAIIDFHSIDPSNDLCYLEEKRPDKFPAKMIVFGSEYWSDAVTANDIEGVRSELAKALSILAEEFPPENAG